MEDIPITFEHEGYKFVSFFSCVKGAGNIYTWDLMEKRNDGNYYPGQMRINVREEFVFTDQKMEKCYLVEYFREIILGWYE